MAKCPICKKSSSNKEELLKHVEKIHKDEIPEDMSTAQYVYSLVHGRPYGICRICGKPTPWNEKAGKPKQICGSPQCKAKVSKEFEANLMRKRNMTRQDMLNNPAHQQKMLANRKISGVYKWSDNKHEFTYTGSYEKYALQWLDDVMNIDPDGIEMPGPTIEYEQGGEKHFWITDMYLRDYNLVVEIKDGNGTGNKNTHPGFAHNRELEKAKDDYMRKQTNCNYIKLTNQNMIQLIDVLAHIRLENIFGEDNNVKSKPVIAINESSSDSQILDEFVDPALIILDNDFEALQEANITSDKIIGAGKNIYFKINALIRDAYRKWNNVKELPVGKEEKKVVEDIIRLADRLIPALERCMRGERVSYESEYEDFCSLINKFKSVRKSTKERNDVVQVNKLQAVIKKIENSLTRGKNILKEEGLVNGKIKNAYWTVCNRTIYCVNLLLYNASGKGMSGHFDKQTGIDSYRYGGRNFDVKVNNLEKEDETKELLKKMRSSTSYSQYKPLFDKVCGIYKKQNVSVFKLMDMDKYNKLVFINYGKLKPMILTKGSKLYHISNASLTHLTPFFKGKDNITFYSTPRIYFTDKKVDPKWALPTLKNIHVYEYEVKEETKAYRDSEYGAWRHPAIYIESDKPIAVKDITDEVRSTFAKADLANDDEKHNSEDKKDSKAKNESFDEYNNMLSVLIEAIAKTPPTEERKEEQLKEIENTAKEISNKYESLSDSEKRRKAPKIIGLVKKITKIILRIVGVGYVIEGTNELKRTKEEMRAIKEAMPMNHEVYMKIKRNMQINSILKIIFGILITMIYSLGIAFMIKLKPVGWFGKIYEESIKSIGTNTKSTDGAIHKFIDVLCSNMSMVESVDLDNDEDVLTEAVDYPDWFTSIDENDLYISLHEAAIEFDYDSLLEATNKISPNVSKDIEREEKSKMSTETRLNNIERLTKRLSNEYSKLKPEEKKSVANIAIDISKKIIITLSKIVGVGFIIEGAKQVKSSYTDYNDDTINVNTRNKLRISAKTRGIVKIVVGIMTMASEALLGIASVSYANDGIYGGLYAGILDIMEDTAKNGDYGSIGNKIADLMESLSTIYESATIETNIPNDIIDALCEGTYVYEDNSLGVLEESATGPLSSMDEAVTTLFNPTKEKWHDIIFGPGAIRNRAKKSSFCDVRVYGPTIEIRGINYVKLRQHMNKLYETRNITKIFEYIYNGSDWRKFKQKKLTRSQCRINYIRTYVFFALELTVMLNELYKEFKLPYYKTLANLIYERTWLSKTDDSRPSGLNITALEQIKKEYKLKPYQYEFVSTYNKLTHKLNLNGYILSFDQGLGKTLTAVALGLALEADVVYVVCPNALKENWANEIKQYFDKYNDINRFKEEVYVHNVSKSINIKKVKYIIVNQEAIPKIYDKVIPGNNLLVVDESHNFRNIDSKRVGELVSLKERLIDCKVLVMSGTPIKASPNEICPALRLIDPLFTDEVAQVYNSCFNMNNIAASGIIQSRFGRVMYRKTKDEVLKLPEKNIEKLEFNVTDEKRYLVSTIQTLIYERYKELYEAESKKQGVFKDEYRNLVTKYSTSSKEDLDNFLYIQLNGISNMELHELDIEFKRTYLSKYVYPNIKSRKDKERLQYLVKHFTHVIDWCIGTAIGEILHPRRKELFMKLYDENSPIISNMIHDNLKKVIIFTPLKDVANHIHRELGNAGLSSVIVTGDINDKLTPILRFKEDPNVDVLVATTQTLGTGVTLTEANMMFFFGTPWRSTDFEQCCDRIHRIGQTEEVFIFNVVMKSEGLNLSARMDQILNWSANMFGTMIDESKNIEE